MEVRRNTRTAPAVGRQQFAQAEQTDFRPLLQGAADLRAGLDIARRERQGFDLQKRLLEESNALQADLEKRRRDPNIDPDNFSTIVDSDYTDRVNNVVSEFRQKGYDPDLLDDFTLGMGRLRNQLTDTATTYQLQALSQRALTGVKVLADEGTRRVMDNPDGYDEVFSYLADTIDLNPDLTADQREAAKQEVQGALLLSGQQSLVLERPQFVLDQLDPDGRWRQQRQATAPVTGSAASVVAVKATGKPKQVADTLSAGGLSAPVVAGFLGNFEVEGGYEGGQGDSGTDPSRADGGAASGIAQWRGTRRDAFRRQYSKEPHEASLEEQANFVLWELTTPEGRKSAGISKERADAILAAETPEEAAELIDRYYERSNGKHRDKRLKAAAKFAGQADLAPGGERVPQAGDVQAIAVPASEAGQEVNQTRGDLAPEPPEAPAPQAELHPVLRDLNGTERLRVLAMADEATRQNKASQKAAMDILIDNVKAEAIANGEIASVIPTEQEILQVYGNVTGPQVASDMRQTIALGKSVREYATMPPEQITAQVERLRPQPGSPTFAVDNELYEAGQKAQAEVLRQRAADPAGYAMQNFARVGQAAQEGSAAYYREMDRALETMGFDPAVTSPLPKYVQEETLRKWPQMSPQARRQWFQENFRTMGEDRLADFARGAEGTDMDKELKIYAFARNSISNATMDEIFAGRDALKKDPARRPSAEKLTEYFRTSAFRAVTSMDPEASAALQEIANSLYVAKGGPADVLNSDLYSEALSQALGGSTPVNLSKGAAKELTILPPTITEARFESWVEGLQKGELTRLSRDQMQPLYGDLKTPVNLNDIVDDGVFVMLAPGSYGIKMASDGRFLKVKNGRNFVVRLKPSDIRGVR